MLASIFLQLATACISMASASSYKPSQQNFATEDANKASPFHDLSAFGIHSGKLPKVYDIEHGNMTYLPNESFEAFQEIKAGLRNRTARASVTARDLAAVGERACNSLDISLSGPTCPTFGYSTSCVDSGSCINQASDCQWNHVTVYDVDNAYITFWASTACNGNEGSFDPSCFGTTQGCSFKQNYASFRAYSGCHSQYSSDGCE